MDIRLSIIIPVYNVEPYLQRCLDSLVSSPVKEMEILLVNDGSTDETDTICRQYADRDKRIRYYVKKNGGQSSARNLGLDYARGEYVCFIDGDDMVEKHFPETILAHLEDPSVDLLYFSTEIRNENMERMRNTKTEPDMQVLGDDKDRLHFICNVYLRNWTNHVCDKCYRMDIIRRNKLHFVTNRVVLEEDLCFNLLYLPYVRTARCIDNILYYYILRENSTMGKARDNWSLRFSKMGQLLKIVYDVYRNADENLLLEQKFPLISGMVLHKMTFDLSKRKLTELVQYISNRDFFVNNWKWILRHRRETKLLLGRKRGSYIILESYLFMHSGTWGQIVGGLFDAAIQAKRCLLGNREL